MGGEYKRVLQMKNQKPMEEEEKRRMEDKQDGGRARKMLKVIGPEDGNPPVLYGEEAKGLELWDIDWEEEMRKREEEMRRREEIRNNQIKKAERMNTSWELARQCRQYITENSNSWRRIDERIEEKEEEERKRQRLLKAAQKKESCMTKDRIRKKQQKITQLLTQIPATEAEEFEAEEKKRDRLEMREINENLWKSWRGKGSIKKKLGKIPKNEEEIDKKIEEIDEKVRRYKEEQGKREDKLTRKKALQDHWEMMKWLVEYTKENQYQWERRREDEKSNAMKEEEMMEWSRSDKETKMKILKESKEEEMRKKETRLGKASQRNVNWKTWRKPLRDDDDEEAESDDKEENDEGCKARNMVREERNRRKKWYEEKESLIRKECEDRDDKETQDKDKNKSGGGAWSAANNPPFQEQHPNTLTSPSPSPPGQPGMPRPSTPPPSAPACNGLDDREEAWAGVSSPAEWFISGWCETCCLEPCCCLVMTVNNRLKMLGILEEVITMVVRTHQEGVEEDGGAQHVHYHEPGLVQHQEPPIHHHLLHHQPNQGDADGGGAGTVGTCLRVSSLLPVQVVNLQSTYLPVQPVNLLAGDSRLQLLRKLHTAAPAVVAGWLWLVHHVIELQLGYS